MRVPLSRPDLSQNDRDIVMRVLSTDQLSIGPMVTEFEKAIADRASCKYAVAVNSGTSGLHLIVRSLGIGDGDEVITTPFSFIASSNSIMFERAKPVFVDIRPDTLNIDPDRIERAISGKTKAILPVHAFGQPADMEPIREIANRHHLAIIEDSCEAIGAEYHGRPAGSFGDAGVFAFYPNKQITTGEGGIIVTNNEEIAKLSRSMRNQGRGEANTWLAHERLGFNYRLDEMSAALGLSQLKQLDGFLEARARVAETYNQKLRRIDGVVIPHIAPSVKMSWFVYVIQLPAHVNRDAVAQYLDEHGVGCRPYFTPIHLQPFYSRLFGYKRGDYPITEEVSSRTLALPFFNRLLEAEIDYVVETLNNAIHTKQSKTA